MTASTHYSGKAARGRKRETVSGLHISMSWFQPRQRMMWSYTCGSVRSSGRPSESVATAQPKPTVAALTGAPLPPRHLDKLVDVVLGDGLRQRQRFHRLEVVGLGGLDQAVLASNIDLDVLSVADVRRDDVWLDRIVEPSAERILCRHDRRSDTSCVCDGHIFGWGRTPVLKEGMTIASSFVPLVSSTLFVFIRQNCRLPSPQRRAVAALA